MTAIPGRPQLARRRFARARRSSGYTQETLAAYLGVERTTVARWENGATEPQPHVRPKIADAIKVSRQVLDELIADTTDDRPAWAIRLQVERETRGWSKYALAKRLFAANGISNGNLTSLRRQIRQWEQGIHFPRDWRTTYAVAFGLEEDELFGNVDYQSGRRPATLDPLPNGEEEDVERRELLENLAALGLSVTPVVQALESIRSGIDRTFESGERQQIEHWEETAVEYGYGYLSAPPQQFVADLAADLVALRLITRDVNRDTLVYKEWCRVGSTLSCLMAKSMSQLGRTREARHWWQTAQSASDSSEDLTARLWVRGQRLIHGIYEQRPIPLLLKYANDAIDLAGGRPCSGLAEISGGRAQTLALAGNPDAAKAELPRLEVVLDRLPTSISSEINSANAMGEGRLRYVEAWVYAHDGDTAKADAAAQRATQFYPGTNRRTPVQVNLLRAVARTHSGDVTEGIRHAQATFEAVPLADRTTMVVNLANRVLEPIPAEQEGQASVTAYRELLMLSAGTPQPAIES
ncbi:helix-turn-helix domain-containing protein [Actinomadura syzygii]|uniref:Helix-turn-helix domain-containing protein n=1 Tax=Actinomadura syzygii TaxID=1427538 RepID=A0A5D0UBI3_9ACTN|nr:helix-turn-helix domain-containing protein [Actinomadura syzygii]TYC15052.1 helix-turn-helix domain-containing protein [Actinomadura syzygii]